MNRFAAECRLFLHNLCKHSSSGERERFRLANLPRYQETTTELAGFPALIPDGPSFAAVYEEVFLNGIYEFDSPIADPRIIDCGANIGLSCIYFKRLYPKARITAFEPDPKIFGYLTANLRRANVSDVEACQAAVWLSNGTSTFFPEGADAGRMVSSKGNAGIEVRTIALRDRLKEKVHFLKIDIEGAETDVLLDCAEVLKNVDRLFVEYHSFAGSNQRLHEILKVLHSAGFRIHAHPILTSHKPFKSIVTHLGMDLQLNIFAFRS